MQDVALVVLYAALGLLGKPLFWICVTAIACANILASGLHTIATAIEKALKAEGE